MVGMCATTIDCLAVCTMNTSAGQWATHRCLAFTACGDCKFKKLRRSLPHTQADSVLFADCGGDNSDGVCACVDGVRHTHTQIQASFSVLSRVQSTPVKFIID